MRDGTALELTITHTQSFSLDDQSSIQDVNKSSILNFILLVVKKTLIDLDYKQVGRLPRFFNTKERKSITVGKDLEIDMWPGYNTDVKHLNDGVFLNVDTATKFISQINIFDEIKQFQKDGYTPADLIDWYVPKDPEKKRIVVITLFNSRIY